MALEDTDLQQKVTQILSKLDPVAILQAGWVSHIPFWLNVLFIILLAKSAAYSTWLIFMPDTVYTVIKSNSTQQNQPQARLNTISRLHLFGMTKGKQAVKTENITKTNLSLVLKGVFASSNPEQAFAIIAESGNAQERTYKVGERLSSGAVLHEVRATEVILNRNGRLESLDLPQNKLDNLPISSPGSARQRKVVTMPNNLRLKKIREAINKSPQKFMENARIEPVVNPADGSTEGFTFNHNDPGVMRSLGILPTDVVTAVNGLSITTNVSVAYDELLSSIKNGTPLSIDFMRKGILQTVNVQM